MIEEMCIANYKTTVGNLNQKYRMAVIIAFIALLTPVIDGNMKSYKWLKYVHDEAKKITNGYAKHT